ncbi:RNA polymerase sigma-70 factor [Aquimarina sp. BL5]|uniref:RNA polymerase sigma factor n=1 Tax=Aquimarina sp. BL5 TaxID=1714860 RepID=UPI000E5557F0|nr:RNA polymerase sigma-70 factor [Aquimarina sp. BL5]AXT53449.1 RNA polymerase sigma-70 factor [Aquimarina sp. BL5]RKN08847.1 RNA polymerase sigma-70 factor [Aquimarina sp. BL5]
MTNKVLHIDNELIKQLSIGNHTAYKVVFTNHFNELTNYVYKLIHDRTLAEDLVQNVFMRLWEKKTKFTINTSLRSYLFKSCHNEFLMYVRQQKKEIDALDTLKWETLLNIHSLEEKEQLEADWQKIEKAIEKLPSKCKKVFKLSRLERKKHKEIAELLGISPKTVEVHIRKAMLFLRTNVSGFFLF